MPSKFRVTDCISAAWLWLSSDPLIQGVRASREIAAKETGFIIFQTAGEIDRVGIAQSAIENPKSKIGISPRLREALAGA
jgi:hypothetical protein